MFSESVKAPFLVCVFVAFAECKHEVALANAREAQKSRIHDFALAGLWVEALTKADRGQAQAATAMLPAIVDQDRDIKDVAGAQTRLDEALTGIGEIRIRYDLTASCET